HRGPFDAGRRARLCLLPRDPLLRAERRQWLRRNRRQEIRAQGLVRHAEVPLRLARLCEGAAVLLVKRTFLLLVCLAAALAPARGEDKVVAENYREFWLWGGVEARPFLQRAETMYLLQGEMGADPFSGGAVVVAARSVASPGSHRARLYLVYRVRSLDFTPQIYEIIRARLARWRREPGEVKGVQIDFDGA